MGARPDLLTLVILCVVLIEASVKPIPCILCLDLFYFRLDLEPSRLHYLVNVSLALFICDLAEEVVLPLSFYVLFQVVQLVLVLTDQVHLLLRSFYPKLKLIGSTP